MDRDNTIARLENIAKHAVHTAGEDIFILNLDDGIAIHEAIEALKAQLSQEGTTSDTISRQWLLECVDEGWIKFDTEEDANRFIHLVRDIAPTIQPVATDTNVGDIISRQQALDIFDDYNVSVEYGELEAYSRDRKRLCELPTVQPERKKGKWIYNSPVTMKCDQCGLVIKDWDWHRFKFCPNCDCDMRGEQE